MLRSAILQPNAFPARIAIVTAPRLSAGSAPGRPRQTGQTWVFAGAPKAVEQPQKILLLVRSCACTSRPMTGSQSAGGIRGLPTDLHGDRARFGSVDREASKLRATALRERKLEHDSLRCVGVLGVPQVGDAARRRDDVFPAHPRLCPELGKSGLDELAQALEVLALLPRLVAQRVPEDLRLARREGIAVPSNGGQMSCSPMGRPALETPQGIEIPGSPARFAGTV